MHSAMDAVSQQLDLLVDALDGHEAGDIVAASEGLSHAVIALAQVQFPAGSEAQAQVLISKTLTQLEAAAIRVNVLKAWTRQRIDRNHQIRGIHPRGLALTY